MEARLEEEKPASMEMKPEVADEEVPLEDAVVMPVGEPRKRRRDRQHLAAQRRQKKEQKRTQRKDGCRKNLVAARRAAVAWRRINIFRKIYLLQFSNKIAWPTFSYPAFSLLLTWLEMFRNFRLPVPWDRIDRKKDRRKHRKHEKEV
jgi:hypothetical protein